MVSSMRVTLSSPTSTMLGRTEVTKVFSGMVDIGSSYARIPGIEVFLDVPYQS